jgi:DNA-binding MarR family transcriptional regulator
MATDEELRTLAVDLLVQSARFTRYVSRRSGDEMPRALWRGLAQIDELGPLRVSDLAVADRISQPTATTIVQRLVERGWVERREHPDDARAVLVDVSPAGRRVLAEQREAAGRALVPDLEQLDADTRRDLARGVAALRALLGKARPG